MNIFPYFLLRVSPESMNIFENLSFAKVPKLLDNFYDLEMKKQVSKDDINEILFQYIKDIKSDDLRKKIINLKRDIFNNRTAVQNTLLELPIYIKNKLDNLKLLELEIVGLNEMIECNYYQELDTINYNFRTLLNTEYFLKGVLQSSDNLLIRLKEYINSETESKYHSRSKFTLLKYLSRIFTKTSPFSTFTNLALGVFDNQKALINVANINHNNNKIVNHRIILNIGILRFLTGVLFQYFPITKNFYLVLNPSIKIKNNFIEFLVNTNNIEFFQSLEINDNIKFILNAFKGVNKIEFKNLSTILSSNFEAEEDEIREFIYKVISIGLLEFDFDVSGLDYNWDVKLVQLLKQYNYHNDKNIFNLYESLIQIRKKITEYEKADFATRDHILNDIFSGFKKAALDLHEAANLPKIERELYKLHSKEDDDFYEEIINKVHLDNFEKFHITYFNFRKNNILFEDTYYDEKFVFDIKRINHHLTSINQLIDNCFVMDKLVIERKKILDFFKSKFALWEEVNILDFYKKYYEFKKETGDTVDYSILDLSNEKINVWLEKLIDVSSNGYNANTHSFMLKNEYLQKVNEILNLNRKFKNTSSRCVFLQYIDGVESKIVINNYTIGFGKWFSRFLHLFESSVTEEILHDNFINNEYIQAEYNGASYFNPNLHPPLLNYEIRSPGSQHRLNLENQIQVSNIYVKYMIDQDRVILIDKQTNKEIYIYDLGFEAQSSKSELFKLLSIFSNSEMIFLPLITSKISNSYKRAVLNEKGIIEYPEITLDSDIILQRKVWYIPVDYFETKLSDVDFFININLMRKRIGIPKEVFVRFYSKSIYNKIKKTKNNIKNSRASHKPQYINFDNPLLVELLHKLVLKYKEGVFIEEMRPNSDEILNIVKEKHISELIIQWKSHE
ncbi:MAG: lantibiotic dehydratase [Ignavibacteria bacterium]|nr:lantibiotic dehydratase [Ignavibacteria bacterium]